MTEEEYHQSLRVLSCGCLVTENPVDGEYARGGVRGCASHSWRVSNWKPAPIEDRGRPLTEEEFKEYESWLAGLLKTGS